MQAKAQPAQRYRAYLVRCWQETPEPKNTYIWRFSLECVGSGEERAGFATLEELFAALMEELSIQPHSSRLQQDALEHPAGRHSAGAPGYTPDYTADYTLDSG